MTHTVQYWRLTKRQADVDDDELRALLGRESRSSCMRRGRSSATASPAVIASC